MRLIARSLLALLLALVALPGQAKNGSSPSRETRWMQVLLDGRKVGYTRITRVVSGDRVDTTLTTRMAIGRSGTPLTLETEEESIETLDGRPLGFRYRHNLAGRPMELRGTVAPDGTLTIVDSEPHGKPVSRPWPDGALMAEGERRFLRAQGLEPGTHYRARVFVFELQDAFESRVEVVGKERVSIMGREQELTRLDTHLGLPGAPTDMKVWVDDEHREQRLQYEMMGMTVEVVASDERRARAPNQAPDILDQTMVGSPRALPDDERRGAERYTLQLPESDVPALPDTGEQDVRLLGQGRFDVTVTSAGLADGANPPGADATASTRWLQSDNDRVRKLARDATEGTGDAGGRMRRLEAFVRGYITRKDLRVGYGTALDVVDSRQGDCTEHAVLLAALGRSLGIPTRVVSGLVYVDAFAGRQHVFVAHAWTQAWVDGRWQSYDAALPAGFDSGHIALGVDNGDPERFYAAVALLGRIKLERVEAIAP